jgi:hypothetical protein
LILPRRAHFANNAGQGKDHREEHAKKSDDENGAVFGAIVLVASKWPESACRTARGANQAAAFAMIAVSPGPHLHRDWALDIAAALLALPIGNGGRFDAEACRVHRVAAYRTEKTVRNGGDSSLANSTLKADELRLSHVSGPWPEGIIWKSSLLANGPESA